MNEGMMLTLFGICMVMQAVRVGTAIWQAMTAQRVAAAMEERLLVEELQMLDEVSDTPEQAMTAQTHQEDEEKRKKPLLVRRGADHISRRRAEAGFE